MFIIIVGCVLGWAMNTVAGQKKDASVQFVEAPIVYEDLMLILADRKGNVAAVRFPKEIVNGVHYEFRFLADGAKKDSQGKGVASQEWKEIEQAGESKFVLDMKSMMLRAGSIELRWAYRNPGSGWIYYDPESLSVQIGGSAEAFKDVDLRRFADKKPRASGNAVEKHDEDPNKMIQAPIAYEDLMLISSDKKGNVAAVMFVKQVQRGVHYKFRFLAHGSTKEVRGKGAVGGIGQKVRVGDQVVFLLDKGSSLIRAGGVELNWSQRLNPGGAWISYFPEAMSVQIAASDRFDDIELNRFVQKR